MGFPVFTKQGKETENDGLILGSVSKCAKDCTVSESYLLLLCLSPNFIMSFIYLLDLYAFLSPPPPHPQKNPKPKRLRVAYGKKKTKNL